MNFEGKYQDVCQSCSMPMKSPGDYGSNADGSQNYEFCFKCYGNGVFLQPDITIEDMIKGCVNIMVQFGMPEAQAEQVAKNTIPTLKRWKK